MWFKLNTTFTTSLGKLSELTNSWPITRYLTNFTTASNVLNVEKNGAYEAVFTIGANCTVDAAPTVTMSGVAVSASQAVWNASAGRLTVKISSVTGPVVITASATKNSSSGGSGGGEPETPVKPPSGTTTWYTGYDVRECSDKSAASFGGFAYSNETMLSKLRNKPINIVSVNIAKAGTFTVGIVDSSNAIVDSVTVTVSNVGIQTIELGKTLNAAAGQRPFVQKPSDTAAFLYEMNNTIPDFPTGMDAFVGVKQTQSFQKYNMNINFGYMTSTTPSTPSDAWYTGYEVLSSCADESSASYGGFAYSNETILSKLRNVPVNAIKANFKKTGTFTVGIVNSSNEIIDSVTVNVASAGVQVVKLSKTMTAGDGQRFFANKPGDTATFLYEITSSIEGFPKGMDAHVGVKTLQNFPKYNMNINFGYVN